MIAFQLFRVKVYPPEQPSLFSQEFVPQLVLVEAIRSKPVFELRRGHRWHIGNVEQLDSFGMYFALGRTTRSTIGLYDESSGDFVEEEFETAPYTHIICDTSLEVCGIARKAQLSPDPTGIARQLQKLLNFGARQEGHQFDISAISDPNEFIQELREAYAVKRFGLTFSPPNPFDVNEEFQKPLGKVLKEAHGKSGKASLSGKALEPQVLEELARSAAATGNQAEATIQSTPQSRPVRRHMAGDVAAVVEEELAAAGDRRNVLQKIRDLYGRIRRSS